MKRTIFILIIISLSTIACKHKDIDYTTDITTTKVLTPINLQPDETLIYLEDMITNASMIDSLQSEFPIHYDRAQQLLKIQNKEGIPLLSTLHIFMGGTVIDVLLKKSLKQKIRLTYEATTKVKNVSLKGEMTAWTEVKPTSVIANRHIFEFALTPGNYQYLYLIDGKETLAVNAPQINNNAGGFNSLLKVKGGKKTPKLQTISTQNNIIEIAANATSQFIVFWENKQLPSKFIKQEQGTYSITIPQRAIKEKRSYLRIWGADTTSYSNDLLIPLEYGEVVRDTKNLTRKDKHTNILYSLMIDRFYDGKKENNFPLNRKDVLPQVDYQGGDLVGITKKIKDGYFTNLGISAIWISPITQNPDIPYGQWNNPSTKFSGYHGYWPISSSKIDYRFGTSKELKELLAVAHEHNINIFLDYVANHVHQEHPFYKQHPHWVTPLYLPDGTKNTQLWDSQRLTTWFDDFMPSLDLENDTVREMMTDSALFWIQNYDFDGFRHDATKHIPIEFWRTLTRKIRHSNNPNIYQIGETYGSRELIGSYVSSGLLDAQFDFNMYDNAVTIFARPRTTNFKQLEDALQETFNYYGYHHLMGNISGNHDRSRFISYASGDVRFDEDAKVAGWTRDIKLTDTTAYAKLIQLNAFNLTIPGIPVIYQGDEYGVPGGNDPDNRRMMQFEGLKEKERQTRESIAKIAKLRGKSLPLLYGEINFLYKTFDVFAYSRTYFGETVVIVFNKGEKPQKLHLALSKNTKLQGKSLFGNKLSLDENTIELTTPKNSVEIIY